jgi:hypothetical protein
VHPVDNLVFALLREGEELRTITWTAVCFVGIAGDVGRLCTGVRCLEAE